MGLRTIREHAMMHRDVCSLSPLKEMGTLDIARAKVSYKRTFMENTKGLSHFAHISHEGC